ncbi:hypothetical protein [Streptomyces sp. NPDC088915]|uniref:hypothetical protein n=1 Tax=Streptomyces sp. NPDC088915 TaxID=3365912 RepID=UPI0038163D24
MPLSVPTLTTSATEFKPEDFVLYRDPAKFWAGTPGHTYVCRVSAVMRWASGPVRYNLLPLAGGLVRDVKGDYMRLLPPLDAMRDIDTAALDTDGAADAMTAAAVAWLVRQHATASAEPKLPAPRD